jgi:hypothetical protein
MMDPFCDLALSQVPRILGLGDRDRRSKTFGCFDRYYWHYRLLDFPNARFQEAALLLALLYGEDFPANIYHGKEKLLEWLQGTVGFWLGIRNGDGSVDEAYPYERSFCATAFSAYAVTESLLLLDWEAPPTVERTADWLAKNENRTVSNQMAASAIALYNFYLLTGDVKYRSAAQDKVEALLQSQGETGCFPEYGGYDVGYQSVSLSLLAKYYLKAQDSALLGPMKKAVEFLEGKVGEDGNYDREGTSRRTQFLYPHGLEVMKSEVIARLLRGLKANRVINPGWLDDRYVIQLTTDYLQTYLEARRAHDQRQADCAQTL